MSAELILIAAVDKNWGLGCRGELLAHVRADLKNFAAHTKGKPVILGSKTLATFPGGNPLKGRENIILSRNPDYFVEGATVMHSVEQLLDYLSRKEGEIYVIGGASIYSQLLPHCGRAVITKFDAEFEADAFLDNLDADSAWKCTAVGERMLSDGETDSVDGMGFYFCDYKRI